jgi:preprotein translocase subunit SecA
MAPARGGGIWRLLQGRSVAKDAARRNAAVAAAGAREEALRALSDTEFGVAAQALRGAAELDQAAFLATAREAARRRLGQRPFDVQLLGATWLLSGRVVEMATGEGKTLTGAVAAAGYALRGRRVHVASVNDYLARRDAQWMRPLYRQLGLTVAWLAADSTPDQRRAAYAADVTYASISELGFDLLRDRTAESAADLVTPEPQVLLVDEADSVLVDEALVPLVLAGAAETADGHRDLAKLVRLLRPGVHYRTDLDGRNVHLTAAGAAAAEHTLGGIDLYSVDHIGTTLPALNVALHAQALLHRDVDYLVRDGRVQLINLSRGRVARLQRWPDGLQAAVEAKEALELSDSGEILDSTTVQSFVGRYPTVCGMSGTALAAGEQLRTFYDLRVAVVPPNLPCVRADEPDRVFATRRERDTAVAELVARVHVTGRPVLVGTADVAESERLANRLAGLDIGCVVLNAKNDAEEAAIIAGAGAVGSVTVSTQMAGRGTDIRLGPGAAELGGLYVIGTARHTSSRLDDQLRGRAGRQGDPGGSVFFAALEDELVRKHGGRGRARSPQARVDHAQRSADGVNMEIHANTWHYHQLTAQHREIVGQRRDALLHTDTAARELAQSCPERYAELRAQVPDPVLAAAARRIALFQLDRCWAEHLAMLADLREGIHLWVLARERPLTQFHRAGLAAFRELLPTAWQRTEESFRTAPITATGLDPDAAGLRRPTSTWTYLVHEKPFGGQSELRQLYGM